MIQTRTFLTSLMLALPWAVRAQTGGVGVGTTTPAASAALDVNSTTKGVLLPRLSLMQRQAMGTGSIAAPVAGLVIYQTDNTPGLYAYDGTTWVRLAADNLGDHTATQSLNLQANALTGSGASLPAGVVGVGVRADGGLNLGQNTAGNNLFLGYQAGQSNTSGNFNLFSGYLSGQNNTTGSGNVFSGHRSGQANTSGNSNVFNGYASGLNNTTGISNVFSGFASGQTNTSGNYNVFSGHSSGLNNLGGSSNVFSGSASGQANTSGNNNAFSGAASGQNNTTGSGNVFNGYASGINNVDGSNNTVLGNNSGPDSSHPSLNNATAVGANVALTTNNTLVLGNGANVGIGTSAPSQKLEVSGGSIRLSTAGQGLIFPDGSTQTTAAGTTNLTGDISSIGATTTYNNVVPATKGGAGTVSGLLKANGAGVVSAAVAGTDYAAATGSTGYIQNGTTTQASSNFNISGNGIIGGNGLVSGRLGIGTTTPTTLIHLLSPSFYSPSFQPNGSGGNRGYAEFMFGNAGLTKAATVQVVDDGNFGGGLYFNVHSSNGSDNWPTGSVNAMAIRATGSGSLVGIGTTTPAYKLDVAGIINSSTGGFRFPDNTVQTTAATGTGFIQNGTAAQGSSNFNISGNGIIGGNNLIGGSVGIGTPAPLAPLDVLPAGGSSVLLGGGNVTGSELKLLRNGVAHISLYNNTGALTIANTSALNLPNVAGTALMTIGGNSAGDSGSNVGIGTTTPTAKLDVQGGADGNGTNDPVALGFSYRTGGYRHFVRSRHNGSITAGGNDLDFYLNNSTTAAGSSAPGTGNIQVLTLENNNGGARVGIGTADPATTLHVAGTAGTANVRLGSLAGAGTRLVTTDASGNLVASTALPTDVTGDDLGNHTATTTLTLGSNRLVGSGTNGLTISSSGDANLTGAASVAYKYATPHTYTQQYGVSDLRPENNTSDGTTFSGTSDQFYATSAGAVFRIPLHLPQGASITGASLSYFDGNSTASLNASIVAYNPSTDTRSAVDGSGLTSAGSSGAGAIVATYALGAPVVNNANQTYSIRLTFGAGATNLTFRGYSLTYTVNQAD